MRFGRWLGRRWEREMDAEFAFHLEALVDDYMREGLSRESAERRARRELGPIELAKEEYRDQLPVRTLDHLLHDVRYAFRSLRKSPGFTAVAVLTLALGTGANTAIFQMLDAVRLRTLHVRNPEQFAIVELSGDSTRWKGRRTSGYPVVTNPLWEELRDRQDVFSDVLAWANTDL